MAKKNRIEIAFQSRVSNTKPSNLKIVVLNRLSKIKLKKSPFPILD